MPSTRVQVRMLVPLGGNKVGDVVWITDRSLDPEKDYIVPDGPQTLVESYIEAGYVELS